MTLTQYMLMAMLVALVVIAGTLLLAVTSPRFGVRRQSADDYTRSPDVAKAIDAAVVRLGKAVANHVDVQAVLEMVRQLDRNPELLDRLGDYSCQTTAAALWLHVDSLTARHRSIERQLVTATEDLATAELENIRIVLRGQIAQMDVIETELRTQVQLADSVLRDYLDRHDPDFVPTRDGSPPHPPTAA